MRCWRISEFPDLSGRGTLDTPGRWNFTNRRMVYLADHPASALLEVLVHMEVDSEDLPETCQLLGVDVTDEVVSETVDENSLPSDWRSRHNVTRSLGSQWLAGRRTALLRVPSAIVPFAWNWLLNPLHADAVNARIADIVRVRFDPRLFKFA
jgi:RES domain-containing protein